MSLNFICWITAGALVLGVVLVLGAAEKRVLILNGIEVQTPLVEMNGHAYVEIEALAQAGNGSVHYQSNYVLLDLRSSLQARGQVSRGSLLVRESRRWRRCGSGRE